MKDFRDIKLSRREFVVAGAASVSAAALPAGAATSATTLPPGRFRPLP
ncbi:hypothetical protein [Cupriavidus sp. EM10]